MVNRNAKTLLAFFFVKIVVKNCIERIFINETSNPYKAALKKGFLYKYIQGIATSNDIRLSNLFDLENIIFF
tara:strand:- start:13250 stop:13465 length:216 start_codon:yes stop_codon:yes gene_type:complete